MPKNSGNSRAEPTLFMFSCNLGECTYRTSSRAHLERHRKQCDRSAPAPRDKICDVCGEAFASDVTLRHHKRDQHTDQERQCPHCGEKFRSNKEYTSHFLREHDAIEDGPIQCPRADDPDCPSPNRRWAKWGALRAHLREYHRMLDSQMQELLGPRIHGTRLGSTLGGWQCPVTDCMHRLQTRESFRAHLLTVHDIPRDEIDPVIGITTSATEYSDAEEAPPIASPARV